ncbi:Tyrosine decarboxylase protein [Dioscorea alata]|uniref:Tyrosine decarboxylase protein n=1 Tax=Dioscorea alata TaxID=55571 RepID=A0ACB7V5X3_DIOAL|nr:Tyrosine decarboxylase protein [Dioscorea alata]
MEQENNVFNNTSNGTTTTTTTNKNKNKKQNPLDPEEFRNHGHKLIDFIADYYSNITNYPVRSQAQPGELRCHLPVQAPISPEPIDSILHDINSFILPGLTHWLSPFHFAYFPSSASTAAFLGDLLCSGLNVIPFTWLSSPSATELESIVMDWLAKALALPSSFLFSSGTGGGVLQGTTCEAILCTMLAAREKTLILTGHHRASDLVVYSSDQAHSSFQKAAKIAGILPSNFRSLPTSSSTFFSFSPSLLRQTISEDLSSGLIPFFICATVGTTSSTAVDPIKELSLIAGEFNLWLHVDSAYAGSAAICPEFRHYFDGVDGASSLSLNAHKWLLTNLDCCCLWVKDQAALTSALSTDPEFLKNDASDSKDKNVVDYKDWQVALSRRFRAMKLWFVLRSHGISGIQSVIRGHVEMAMKFEGMVAGDRRFEVVVPRTFAMVCFRLLAPEGWPEEVNELNRRLLEGLNKSGRVCMSHAVVGGVYVIRFAIGATLTEQHHVDLAWRLVRRHADDLLGNVAGEEEKEVKENGNYNRG